ncbi:tetratricopeptide repeat protein [Caldimonas sp.]|uniref:tetratricopeptide repeat protein n=1 Tax=Caldimonas sp. TaxID=2838790 RepID=UPI00391BD588
MSEPFERAKALFFDCLAHLESGRLIEAEQAFSESLALVPGRASTLSNLGVVRRRLGRLDGALAAFDELVRVQPEQAEAWLCRGEVLLQLDRHEEALADYDRCLAIDPNRALAWSRRGSLLRLAGRLEEAADAFKRALTLGDDSETTRYFLASVAERQAPPAVAPAGYVQSLFDDYADDFDHHLVDVLHYDVPQRLLGPLAGRRFAQALDLGCGTGLCAPLLAPLAAVVDAVDLSERMVAKARERGLYRDVTQADLVAHLQTTERRYDLVAAADVFIYIGDLAPVFAGVRRVIEPGGVFAFSAEQGDEARDFVLRPSLTYGHSSNYLKRLAAEHGFEVADLQPHALREDQRRPVPGWLVWLRQTA